MANILGTAGSDNLVGTSEDDFFIGDPQLAGFTVIVSGNNGITGNLSSVSPTFSTDGDHIAFVSASDNLVSGDTNASYDIYLKNIRTGAVSLLSTTSSGGIANGSSDLVRFTPDGAKVVFLSAASNLVAGDTNAKQDLFIKDLASGQVTRISTGAGGLESNGDAGYFDVSADGTKIVFSSAASNLVAGDTNGGEDIFVKDVVTGAITLVSTSASGVIGDIASRYPSFSPDGNSVLFSSFASNLGAGSAPGSNIFLKNLITGQVIEVSTNASGQSAVGTSEVPIFSPDGTKVVFYSSATNLVSTPNPSFETRLYMKDLASGAVTLLSSTSTGQPLAGTASGGNFSPDGSSILLTVTSIVGTSIQTQSYIKSIVTGELTNISTFVGLPASVPVYATEFSPDGIGFSFNADIGGISQSYYFAPSQLGSAPDVFNGGEGFDTVTYHTATQRVEVNLSVSSGLSNVGDALGDTYTSIEGYYLSDFDDRFIGSANNDSVVGGAGADNLNGGAGIGDRISYQDSSVGVTINLQVGTGVGGTAQGDVVINFEGVIGSEFGDSLIGSSGDNILEGRLGDDSLQGADGADLLKGGDGIDTLNGGAGVDTADFSDKTASVVVALNGASIVTASVGSVAEDTLLNFENLIGGNGADRLTGDALANRIEGGSGADIVNGGAGIDTLIGGDGVTP